MKKGAYLAMLLVLVSVTISSCKKDDGNNKSGTLASGVIEGKLDGTLSSLSYITPGTEEYYQWYDESNGHTTTLSRYRSANDFENWTLAFYSIDWDTVTVPYTYDISHDHDAYEVEFTHSEDIFDFPVVSTSGTITITKVSATELEGTVEGVMENNSTSYTVTAGRFKVPYVRL